MNRTNISLLLAAALLSTMAGPSGLVGGQIVVPKKKPLYDREADGFKQIADAVVVAKADGKHILLDFGFNGCIWCTRLHKVFENNKPIRQELQTNYVVVYIDWKRPDSEGQGGHNVEVNAQYQANCTNGVPSLVVLDTDGRRLTTKDTAELEAGNGYNSEKVLTFLKEWAPKR